MVLGIPFVIPLDANGMLRKANGSCFTHHRWMLVVLYGSFAAQVGGWNGLAAF